MMPIGPMMIEHRLIERFIGLMKQELERLRRENRVNTRFVDRAVDFIRTYADRCHHGKEEDILFRELRKKSISGTHEKMLDELIEDHRWGRETTGTLADASARYQKGQTTALSEIGTCMEDLIDFYPKHIEKEDKHFFLPVMDYFSDPEKDAMLQEGYAFDSGLIHQEYADRVSDWENGHSATEGINPTF